ncbi:PIR Superfamily Protein [Plasmodium malariae]|uniref:PIR Superfamily Protein n=1 Tax=Plasmodium malariae TaxID=5858 RepID=A0A1A8WWG7_PLAMA|nr:PIR Superfamily Protein [Plasmodium malariae]
MNEEVYDEILKSLPSYKIYEEYGSKVSGESYGINCNIFNSVKKEYKNKCINLCNKVVRNLENFPEKGKSGNYKDYCTHYIYWIYKEIREMFKKGVNDNDIADVISKFIELQSTIIETYRIYNCSYKFVHKNLNELNQKKEEKYLYEYFTNYDIIKSRDICTSVNPNNLLSVLDSTNNEGCSGLKSIAPKIFEKNSDSTPFNQEFMKSIYFTGCPVLKSDGSSSNNGSMSCNLFRANVNPRSIVTENGKTAQQDIPGGSSLQVQVTTSKTYLADIPSEKNKKQEVAISQGEKNKRKSEKIINNEFRWNFGKGTLRCPPNKPEEDEYGMCDYMEELVEDNFYAKTEDSKDYQFKRGPSWKHEYLESVTRNKRHENLGKSSSLNLKDYGRLQDIVHKRAETFYASNSSGKVIPEKYTEYNILQNTFVRISIVSTSFTPFGSYVGKNKKRKKRYRINLAQLNTQRIPRRFIKRTYRNSDRRRFSVVNIE